MMDMENHRHAPPVATARCAALRSLLPLLSSGTLSPSEAEDARAHVATCAWCQDKLASFAVVEDALRRHYGAAVALADGAELEPQITLDDVLRTAAVEVHPAPPALSALDARRLARRPHLSAFGALAAGLVIALLAALILGQAAWRGVGTHHPTPIPSPRPGTRPVLPTTIFDPNMPSSSSPFFVLPSGITAGPDGNLWVACGAGLPGNVGWICRVTPSGVITRFSVSHRANPTAIVVGSDRNLWFNDGSMIGRITPRGAITEFPLPDPSIVLSSLAAGPDGNVWFTATTPNGAGLIGRMTLRGAVTMFAMTTTNMTPQGITVGPDGALWFTEYDYRGNGKIGRITTQGAITEFAVPTPGGEPLGITAGPDGDVWFTEILGNKIGRITTRGAITEFAIPTPDSGPRSIIAGPDSTLWFAEDGTIARITPQGAITEFSLLGVGSVTGNGGIHGLAYGHDGHLWLTTWDTHSIARVDTIP